MLTLCYHENQDAEKFAREKGLFETKGSTCLCGSTRHGIPDIHMKDMSFMEILADGRNMTVCIEKNNFFYTFHGDGDEWTWARAWEQWHENVV